MKYVMCALALAVAAPAAALPLGPDLEPVWASCPHGINRQCDRGFTVYAQWDSLFGGRVVVEHGIVLWWRVAPHQQPEVMVFPAQTGVYELPYDTRLAGAAGAARMVHLDVRAFGVLVMRRSFAVAVLQDARARMWLVVTALYEPVEGG